MQGLQDIHAALEQQGFSQHAIWERGVFKYDGQLYTSKGPIDVELTLKGMDKPPTIRLINIPEQLKPIAPHIGAHGDLCYTAGEAIAFDIFNPASQVISCIQRATEVLSQILDDERVEDLADEFFVYWDMLASTENTVYLDTKNTDSAYVGVRGITDEGGKVVSTILTDDRAKSLLKFERFGLGITEIAVGACVIKTTANPLPLTNGTKWPPPTLEDFIEWQYALDPRAAVTIIRRMKALYMAKNVGAVIVMSSPTAKYSACVEFPNINVQIVSKKQARKILGPSKVTPVRTVRLDDMYMVERNQPNRNTLMSKKILLIGAGAIGGHLADLLVRGGAGLGGGELIIIDNDVFGIGNIGRHRLGFESLYSNKSEAISKQLRVSFPTVNIKAIVQDVKDYSLTDGYDMVINATGEQSLSDWLSMQLNNGEFSPMLSVWIEGPGAVVRSILQRIKTDACYRCLVDETRTPLYPSVVEDYEIKMGGHGCESLYVEYPATAAVFAAALGAAHVMDYVNGESAPLLRTMVIDRNYTKNADDQYPAKQPECPACRTTETG